jgi:probable DNA metabolism protein
MTLVYDSTFAGFLTAVHHARESGAAAIERENMEASLFSDSCFIRTDRQKAGALWLLIKKSFGKSALDDYSSPSRVSLMKAAWRTRRELHMYQGILRFTELSDGSLYAIVQPDCDILPLMADHFSERYHAFRWVIRDRRRSKARFHETGRGALLAGDIDLGNNEDRGKRANSNIFSADELSIREAWKSYFRHVTIRERTNPHLQRSFMRKKYCGLATEFEGI